MKIASLLFIPALLLSGLTARAGLPASFKERLAEASRENRTIQCDFTQRKQVRRMKNEIELKGRFYYDNSLAMALDYTVPEGDKVIIRNDRIILKTAGQVTQTATSANPMLQQVALMIRASMTGDLSQFGQGWQIGYLRPHGTLRERGRAFGLRIPQQAFQPPGRPRKVQPLTLRPHPMQDLFTSIDNYLAQEGHYAFRVRLDASHPVYRGHFPGHPVLPGVCTLQLVRECLNRGTGRRFRYAAIRECKFLGMVVPQADELLEIDIRVGDDTPEGTRLSCTITNHGKTVLKLRGTVCEMP